MPTQAARRRSVRNLGLSWRWALWLAWPVWTSIPVAPAPASDVIEVGTSVYLTADAQGRDGDRVIPRAAFWQPCWVEAIDGERLWLEQGWVDRRDVLTPAQAVDYYSRRIERGPASATDYLQRAMARGTLGDHDAASADFEAARRLDPDSSDIQELQAESLPDEERRIAELSAVIRADPECVRAYWIRGRFLLEQSEPVLALEDLNAAIRLDPERARLYVERGTVQLEREQSAAAIEDCTTALRYDPKYQYAYWIRLTAYLSEESWQLALDDCEALAKLDPRDADTFAARGIAEMGLWRFNQARQSFDQALAVDPKCEQALLQRADYYLLLLRTDAEALADCTAAIEYDADCARAYLRRGQLEWNCFDCSELALADLNRSLELEIDDEALSLRAQICMAQGDDESAIQDLDHALELNSANPESFRLRAEIHVRHGRFESAIEDLSAAIKLDPTWPDHLHRRRALARIAARQMDDALDDLDIAVRTNRYDDDAVRTRGTVRAELEQFAGAVDDLSAAHELLPEDCDVTAQLAFLLATARDDRIRDGRAALELAADACQGSNCQNPQHLAALAAALAETRDFGQAKAMQQKAVELSRNDDEKRSQEQRLETYRAGNPLRSGSVLSGSDRALSKGERAQAQIELAQRLRSAGWKRKPVELLTAAIALEPEHRDARIARSEILCLQCEYDEAVADLNEAIRVDPKFAPSYRQRAICRAAKQEQDLALADYCRAVELDPDDVVAQIGCGGIYVARLDNDAALRHLDAALRGQPDNAPALRMRAEVHGRRGEFELRMADLDELVRLAPDDPQRYEDRARAWRGKPDYDRAIADYTQAINLRSAAIVKGPSLARLALTDRYLERATTWHEKCQSEQALADVQQALAVDPLCCVTGSAPWCAAGRRLRARIRAEQGEFDSAVGELRSVLDEDPRDAEACAHLAWIEATCPEEKFRNGRHAVELASKACELTDSKSYRELTALAAAYAENGDFAQAVEWQRKAGQVAAGELEKQRSDSRLEQYDARRPSRDAVGQPSGLR